MVERLINVSDFVTCDDHVPGPSRRPAVRMLTLLAVVVPVGLLARHLRSASPNPVTEYLGDALWPVPFFCLLALALPRARTATLAAAALAITLVIEFSQLIHTPALDHARSNPLLGILLGHTFLWSDVACLLAGTALCALLDLQTLRPAPPPT